MTPPLIPAIRRIRRRLLLVRATEAGLLGALAAAPVAAMATAVRILWPESVPHAAEAPALPLALLPCGFALAFIARLALGVSLRQAAIAADHAADLKECLASALEVLQQAGDAVRVPLTTGEEAAAGAGSQPSAATSAPGTQFPRHGGPSALGGGLLGGKLLAQAAEVAQGLDPTGLRLWRTGGRSVRLLLAAAITFAAAALVPSRGGPPVPRAPAQRAAEALHRAAEEGGAALAPAVREAVARAAAALARPGAHRAAADATTAAVFQAAARAEQARRAVIEELAGAADPDVQALARAAAQGDADGAATAARTAAARLAAPSGAGGAAEADRRRVADGLSGAARAARSADLPRLAAELDAAADALRRADADAARLALERVAGSLAADSAAAAQAVLAAVAEARRAVGLPELSAVPGGYVALPSAASAAAPKQGSEGSLGTETGAERTLPTGAAPPPAAIPAQVRPEDRQVVRRYFGG